MVRYGRVCLRRCGAYCRFRIGGVCISHYCLAHHQTVGRMFDPWFGYRPRPHRCRTPAEFTESVRPDSADDRCPGGDADGDHLWAVSAAPIAVAGVGDVGSAGIGLAVNRVPTASAQIVVCEISGSAGDSGRVTTSATSPFAANHRRRASSTMGPALRARGERKRA